MNECLVYNISPLLNKPTGTREIFQFQGPVKLEGIEIKSDISGKNEIMRIDEGLNVKVYDVSLKVKFTCEKCLKPFVFTVKIPSAERQFYLEKPKKFQDVNDLFLVDKKKLTVDTTEMLRQEIILHFPEIAVCSKSCKGICAVCGKDRNKVKCKCVVKKEEYKPLSKLKDLIK